jgi:hypothetical protein
VSGSDNEDDDSNAIWDSWGKKRRNHKQLGKTKKGNPVASESHIETNSMKVLVPLIPKIVTEATVDNDVAKILNPSGYSEVNDSPSTHQERKRPVCSISGSESIACNTHHSSTSQLPATQVQEEAAVMNTTRTEQEAMSIGEESREEQFEWDDSPSTRQERKRPIHINRKHSSTSLFPHII